MKIEDVVIVGAGPAGIAAAIQLRRSGVDPLVFESGTIGGLLRSAHLVENYPGFPAGISGVRLADRFRDHFEFHGIRLIEAPVQALSRHEDKFCVQSDSMVTYTRYVIIASGTRPRSWESFAIPNELENKVFNEIMPLKNVENKHITIIGAGDAAFDYGMALSSNNDVLILNRGERKRCLPLLWSRSQDVESIQYRENCQVVGINPDSGGVQIDFKTMHSETVSQIQTDYVLIAIGREPNLEFLKDDVRNESDKLIEDGRLFYIGDVKNDRFRQTAICVGDGVKAAMKIHECYRKSKA